MVIETDLLESTIKKNVLDDYKEKEIGVNLKFSPNLI